MYRGINSALFVGTNWVEDRGVSATAVAANQLIWNPSPAGDTAWNTSDANNWIKKGLPGAFASGNHVEFTDAGLGNIVIDAAGVAPESIFVGNTNGTYTFSGGEITGRGGLTKSGAGRLRIANTNNFTGGTIVAAGTLAVDGSLAGTVEVNSGATLRGAGNIGGQVKVKAGGLLTPGNSPGILSVGSLALLGNSTLEIELGGTTPGTEHDQLQVAGTAALAGTLQVSWYGHVVPAIGDSFDVLDWASRTGTFDSISLPTLGQFMVWDTSQLYVDGTLKITSSLPGDFDHNGTVDAADYTTWRNGLGTLYTQEDYTLWKSNFGQSVAGFAAAALSPLAVPEPALLATIGGILLFLTPLRAGRTHGTCDSSDERR